MSSTLLNPALMVLRDRAACGHLAPSLDNLRVFCDAVDSLTSQPTLLRDVRRNFGVFGKHQVASDVATQLSQALGVQDDMLGDMGGFQRLFDSMFSDDAMMPPAPVRLPARLLQEPACVAVQMAADQLCVLEDLSVIGDANTTLASCAVILSEFSALLLPNDVDHLREELHLNAQVGALWQYRDDVLQPTPALKNSLTEQGLLQPFALWMLAQAEVQGHVFSELMGRFVDQILRAASLPPLSVFQHAFGSLTDRQI